MRKYGRVISSQKEVKYKTRGKNGICKKYTLNETLGFTHIQITEFSLSSFETCKNCSSFLN